MLLHSGICMISAVRRIQEFTANLSFENYQESLLIQSAVGDN